jgi:O-6-methylguanine DNA methyltransferase
MTQTLMRELRALRDARAPGSIVTTVMDRLGIARRGGTPATRAAGEAGAVDRYAVVKTVLGPVFVAFSDRGVTAVVRGANATAFEREWTRAHGAAIRRAAPPAWLAKRLARGARASASTLRADLAQLTPFEQAVLRKAAEIPAGEVRTYTWVAKEIGHPAAVRAVGSALGRNPMPLVIPCHRVVRTDGTIGDFIYGTPAKRKLLASEGVDPAELETQARRGARYVGSDTTKIYCFPTCRAARRITPKHRVPFPSPRDARASGYRPCKLCRPAAA